VHGLIFFYLQKFADVAAAGGTSWDRVRSTVAIGGGKYLPSGAYPDAEAVAILSSIAETAGRPLPTILEEFGEYLAPHLIKIAGTHIDPSWRTLDLIEHTEAIIHTMIRATTPGAAPPVLETARPSPDELHLVYNSARRLCPLAHGLIRGLAAHYGETVRVEEPSCLLRGDPFCSFVVENVATDTHEPRSPLTETTVLDPAAVEAIRRSASTAADSTAFVAGSPRRAVPESIGGNRVLSSIGRGAMGEVYLAEDRRLGRRVAIKVMHPSRASDGTSRQRFIRESRATAAVEHAHVVAIHQVGEHEGLPYIVMQYLQGDTLASYRRRMGRVPLLETLRIGREIAEGLAAAHDHALIHRDIKPDNVFLEGPKRQVKIIDFGLARGVGDDAMSSHVTHDGAVVGTPAYMAPERIGDGVVDARSDIFGLGVILYELLADRLPFEGMSMMAMLAAIGRGCPTDLGSVAADVPAEVSSLVMRLIAHDPADRPASAEAVADELAALERRLRPA
jgi:tRNA A-37 threonylcarbamoyl transferase component Bud32/predicted hydrocarbon binding protein